MLKYRQLFYVLLLILSILAPWFFYPIFLMKILCFALFASAFNLLLGYTGLLSFGHAAFLVVVAIYAVILFETWASRPSLVF